MIENVTLKLLTTRLNEVRLIRLKEFAVEPQMRFATNANIITKAGVGQTPGSPPRFLIASNVIIELRYLTVLDDNVPGDLLIELHLSVEGAFDPSPHPELAIGATIAKSVMNEMSERLINVAEVHIRNISAMAQLPFVLDTEKLVEIASQSQTIQTPSSAI